MTVTGRGESDLRRSCLALDLAVLDSHTWFFHVDELERYDPSLESSAAGIPERLHMHTSTTRAWIRIGHSSRELPLTNAAFRANVITYAKAQILPRWADTYTEAQLLALAENRRANRLTTAIARRSRRCSVRVGVTQRDNFRHIGHSR